MERAILVIGGTRFFGVHLVRRLIEAGHQVTLATRGLTPDEFGAAFAASTSTARIAMR